MNRRFKKYGFALVVLLMLLFVLPVRAQHKLYDNPKYGPDSASRVTCLRNLSIYREFAKQDNYQDALNPWQKAFHICPKASKNLYIDGVKIAKHFINKAEDDAKREAWIDTLMKVYDQRIEYFDQEGFVLGRKGINYLRYKKDDIEDVKKGLSILEKSIEIGGMRTEEAVLVTYMTATEMLFKSGELDQDEVLQNYSRVTGLIEKNLTRNPNDRRAKRAKSSIDMIYERSGAATCESLISLFGPRIEENPDDLELINKTLELLDETGCRDSELFYEVSEIKLKLEPEISDAYNLAFMSRQKDLHDKVLQYYKIAIELVDKEIENENRVMEMADLLEIKAQYYTELGEYVYREDKDLQQSREYARQAIKADPNYGKAYLLIGNIYASVKDYGENDLENKSIYWLAVDYYQKAKQLDPNISDDAEKQIDIYSQYFPKKETIFFYGYNEGDPFEIDSWINETTKVRSN